MNCLELCHQLNALNAPADSYAIGGIRDEALCLIEEGGVWRIFFSERSLRTEEQQFDREDVACEVFLQRLKRMLGLG